MKRRERWLVLLSIAALLLVTLLGGIVNALAGEGGAGDAVQEATGDAGDGAALEPGDAPAEPEVGNDAADLAAPEPEVQEDGGAEGPLGDFSTTCCPAPEKGKICVIKFLDLDKDGKKDAGESGMPGVTIKLNGGNPKVTGSDGKVCYEGLEAGWYTVSEVVPANYKATTETSYQVEITKSCSKNYSISCTIPSCSYNTVTVFFGNTPVELPKPGSISGHKFHDLDGDGVLDTDEPPLAGVTIELWQGGSKVDTKTTGADGSYSFTDLEPGTYTVKEVLTSEWEATSPSDGSHDNIAVAAGQDVTGIDFLNKKKLCRQGKVEVLVFEDGNCNGVLDGEDKLTTMAVQIELYHYMGGGLVPANGWDGPYSKPTGAGPSWWPVYPHGCASWQTLPCRNIPPGTDVYGDYVVRMVVPAGWTALEVNWAGKTYTTEFGTFHLQCLFGVPTCTWQQIKFLITDIPQGSVFHISGHKYNDLDGDGVLDPGEPGLEGWTIELWQGASKVSDTTTDENGYYIFDELPHGVYTVKEVLKPGWSPTNPADGVHESVAVGCGDNAEGVDFFNQAEHCFISGHKYEDLDGDGVLDPGEPGLEGWTIELWQGASKVSDTTTGPGGFYKFDDLDPGAYDVKEVLKPGWFPTNPADGVHENIVLTGENDVEGIDFLNCEYATIRGIKFLDLDEDGAMGPTEEGLDGVTITLNPGGLSTVTASGGLFAFENLKPGNYEVAVDESSAPGYYATTPTSVMVVLVSGDEKAVSFGNAPYGSISGHKWLDADRDGVWDVDETVTIPGVTIKLYEGDTPVGDPIATTITGPDGSYAFPDLEAGTYTLVEEAKEGYFPTTPTSFVVVLSPGEGEERDFGNCPYSRIDGLKFEDLDGDGVQDAGEEGLEGVEITLVGTDYTETTHSGEDGTFSFENLIPGDYTVSEKAPAGYYATSPVSVDITLEPGEEETVIFSNAPYGSISGTKWLDVNRNGAIDGADTPLEGVTIKLEGKTLGGDLVSFTKTTGSDGTYSFLLLEAGDYTVSEEHDTSKYYNVFDTSMDVKLAPGEERKDIDFLNAEVPVGGEVVTPPKPPAITAGTTALPATGMEQLPLLLVAVGFLLAGLALLVAGLRRRYGGQAV